MSPLNQFEDLLADVADERPFEAFVGEQLREQETRLRVSTAAAREVNPDRAAASRKLAIATGLPPEVIERNFDDIQKRQALSETPYTTLLRDSPALAQWLSEPRNAAVAQDDVPTLGTFERTVGIGRNVLGAGVAGLMDFSQGLWGALQAGAEAANAPALAEFSRGTAQIAQHLATRARGAQEDSGFVERSIYSGIESVGQMAPGLLAGAFYGPAALLGLAGTTTAGQSYAQAREQGVSPHRALTFGAIQGAVEVATEYIPASRLLGDFAKRAPLVQMIVHQLESEIPGEQVATVLQDLNEWATLPANKDRPFSEYLRERPSAAAATLIATITSVGATTIVGHTTARLVEQWGQAAQGSKTLQRSPEALQEFLSEATKDGDLSHVYAPLDTWTTYWQSKGLNPADMAAQVTGDPQAYRRAQVTGEDLAIPTANYITQIAHTEHNAFFANELRLGPEEQNGREAAALEQAFEQAATVPAEPSATAPIRESIVGQLEAAGTERSTAEAYATLYEQAFQTLGERAGTDPVALFQRYGLQITREGMPPGAPTPSLGTEPAPGSETAVGAPAALDITAAEGETRPDVPDTGTGSPRARPGETGRPAVRRVEASVAPRRESVTQRTARRQQHYADVFDAVLAAAQGVDPTVDPAALRAEFEARVDLVDSLDAEFQESGHNLRTVLQAIADAGGLSLEAEARGGLAGELRWVRESPALGPFGSFAGVRGVFRARDASGRVARTGLSLDDMVGVLRQDPRFSYLTDLNDLLAVLEDAARQGTADRGGTFPGTRELAKAAGIHLDRVWWRTADLSDAVEPDGGDVSFDITEFNQSLLDQLAQAPGPQDSRVVPFPSVDYTTADRLFQATDWTQAQQITVPVADLVATQSTVSAEIVAGKQPGGALPRAMAYQGKYFLADGTHAAVAAANRGETEIAILAAPVDASRIPDVLDTGELQPRLPGAGAVRDQNIATPQFEAPFSLTAPTAKGPKGRQSTLFQDRRGRITFGADRQFSIELLAKADLSTFLHESGHFFLEVMRDLAPQSEQIAADLETIRTTYGDEPTAQHEGFARAFEGYLLEGHAPSVELRPVFARFRAWLLSVYRSLRNLNVNLTSEVRGVFDRLLASDDAIAQAEREGRLAPLFMDPATAGMTDAQFATYRETVQDASVKAREELEQRVLGEWRRAQQEWWKAERATIRERVAAEVHQQPVYRALAAIRKGTHPDGTSLVEGQEPVPMKLSKADIVTQYGPERLKALPKPYVYTVEGGLHPDLVAELYGFSSGDELLTAITQAAPMTQAIETETDARMTAKHGDLLLDGRLPEQARQAVFGEGRQQLVRAELAALSKAIGRSVNLPARAVKQMAQERIAKLRLRDLRPGQFLMAAQRASARAFDLVNADRVAAAQAKQQEAINLALYREALEARDAREDGFDWIRQHDTAAARSRLGKVDPDYVDQWDGILDRYELKRVPQKVLDRRAAILKWVASQEAQGLPVDLPDVVLDEARRVNWQTLTVEEFAGLVDGLKQIQHLARLKGRLLKAKDQRDLQAAVAEITGSIAAHSTGARTRQFEVRLPQDRFARAAAESFAAHRKLSSFIRQMDGWQDGGVLWERILRPINEAGDTEALRNAQETQRLADLFDAAFKGQEHTLYVKSFIPAISGSLTRMGRIAAALNVGNEGNRQRLRDGHGWTDAQVDAILATLTDSDWRFVQSVWDYLDSFRPEIAAKERRVHGVEPEWVTPMPVVTRFGTFKGGYYPIAYEGRLSARAASNLEATFADSIKQASYVKATTRRGHLEARQQAVKEPLRLDFGVLTEHVQQVVHDLTHHEMLIDVGRLLSNRAVQDAMYTHHGSVVYEQLKGAIRDIAWGNAPAPSWYRPLNYLRQGVVTASLGWNVLTSVIQPTQVVNGMVRVGPTWVLRGMYRWARNAASFEGTAAWIQDRSVFMRTRGQTQFREINEIRNRIGLDRGVVSGWMHDALSKAGVDPTHIPVLADTYFYTIQKGQQIADIPTWLGAYEKAMADPANDEDRAVALADQAVIDSQASGHIKDLSQVERGGPILKVLTTFYSFQNLLLNQSVEVIGRTNFRSPSSLARGSVDALLLLFVPLLFVDGLRRLFRGGDDDDEGLAHRLARLGLSELFGMFVGARELTGLFEGYDYTGSAGQRWAATLYRAGTQIKQGELDPAFWRALNQAGGTLLHYPATQVQRTAEGFNALVAGQTKNPAVLLTGAPEGR